MEDIKQKKFDLTIFLLIISIFVIVVLGYLVYNISNEKHKAENKITEMEEQIHSLENQILMKKFSYDDLFVDNLRYGMTENEVIEIMGEPSEKKVNPVSYNIFGNYIVYIYDGLSLTFYEHDGNMLLSGAGASSSKYTFARGLKVGDSREKVINSFYKDSDDESELREFLIEKTPASPDMKYLYGNGIGENIVDSIKTTGKVQYAYTWANYNQATLKYEYQIHYAYSEPPYKSIYADDNMDVNGNLIFYLDSDNIVTDIRWEFNPKI